jgi:peptide/nickel transport system substrate-binding protein
MKRATALLLLPVLLGMATTAGATGTREVESKQILDFALSGDPDTLDPHATSGTLTFQVLRSLYDTLVEPDAEGNIMPALAESWEISDDYLTWTLTLRESVLFHNGDTLTSDDVRATLERVLDEEIASPKAGEFDAIETIRTPDSRTVILELSQPSAPLLSALASGWGAILPESLIESGHDFATEPVGTGPFRMVEWVRDNRIVLEKNEAYWMPGRPSIDGVVINIIPEDAVMVQGLLTGDLDAVESVTAQDLPMLEANRDITVQTDLSTLVMVLAMNTQRPPLDSVAIRQAVAQAIDKESVMEIAYGGGEVVNTFMDYANPYYVAFDYNPYDPEAARAALVAAGYDDSEPLIMKVPENYEAHVKAGEMYQEMLESVGMNVELQLIDWSTWLGEVYRGDRDYDFTVIGHTGKLDPSGRLGDYGTGASYVQWTNSIAADAISQAAAVVDPDERMRLYSIALEQMSIEVPQVYVGTSYRYLATQSNVHGLRQDTQLDTFDFRYVEIDE